MIDSIDRETSECLKAPGVRFPSPALAERDYAIGLAHRILNGEMISKEGMVLIASQLLRVLAVS